MGWGADLEMWQDFVSEVSEHTEKIELDCLALEGDLYNADSINSLFRSFHTIKGLAGFVEHDLIQQVAHATEGLLQECRKECTCVVKAVVDLILTSTDIIRRLCQEPDADEALQNLITHHIKGVNQQARQNTGKPLGELLVEERKLSGSDLSDLLDRQKEAYAGLKLGQVAVKEKKVGARDVIDALREQEALQQSGAANSAVVRVSAEKIDTLTDMLGELLILQAAVEQAAKRAAADDALLLNFNRMAKVTKRIQETAMSMRLVSLKQTFQRLIRTCRDATDTLGKQVHIDVQGEETEIDRGVADKLLEPLMHLVRNAVAHGIEDVPARLAASKPEQGTVTVKAYGRKGYVYIEIGDDGGGICVEKVAAKARDSGLIPLDKQLSTEETLRLIFMPGFSTKDRVDDIAGRGVGLDVVKTGIARLGGKIDIVNRPGQGCTFTLKIPINSAIINGTIINIDGHDFIVPTSYVKRIVQISEANLVSVGGQSRMVRIHEEVLPMLQTGRVLSLNMDAEKINLVLVLEVEENFAVLPVTAVTDRRDVVVKPLGEEFRGVDYLAGASILGNGKVSLILDVEHLMKAGESSDC